MNSFRAVIAVAVVAAAFGAGCSASPPPRVADAPANVPSTPSATAPATGLTSPPVDTQHIVVGGADSVGAIPGSPGSAFVYVFRQTDPASDRFTFQDRDLSFYFRPSPTVLHFQVENRQDRPVWIEWDRSSFTDSYGASKKLANSETRWPQRYTAIAPTQIVGLQRYSNYVFPIDYLVDPGASSGDQLHRPIFPEDQSATTYVDREFAVNLVFRLQDRLQPYSFRFKVRSVLPR